MSGEYPKLQHVTEPMSSTFMLQEQHSQVFFRWGMFCLNLISQQKNVIFVSPRNGIWCDRQTLALASFFKLHKSFQITIHRRKFWHLSYITAWQTNDLQVIQLISIWQRETDDWMTSKSETVFTLGFKNYVGSSSKRLKTPSLMTLEI